MWDIGSSEVRILLQTVSEDLSLFENISVRDYTPVKIELVTHRPRLHEWPGTESVFKYSLLLFGLHGMKTQSNSETQQELETWTYISTLTVLNATSRGEISDLHLSLAVHQRAFYWTLLTFLDLSDTSNDAILLSPLLNPVMGDQITCRNKSFFIRTGSQEGDVLLVSWFSCIWWWPSVAPEASKCPSAALLYRGDNRRSTSEAATLKVTDRFEVSERHKLHNVPEDGFALRWAQDAVVPVQNLHVCEVGVAHSHDDDGQRLIGASDDGLARVCHVGHHAISKDEQDVVTLEDDKRRQRWLPVNASSSLIRVCMCVCVKINEV